MVEQDEVIGPYKAGQSMGVHGKLGTRNDNNMDHTGLRGFGNVGNDRKEGVRLDVKLGEKSNLAVAIFTPNVNAVEGNWNAADEEETLPRIDIVYSVSLGSFSLAPDIVYSVSLGSFSLAPGFSWQSVQYEWDPQAGGGINDESDFEAWVWSLPVKFAPGGPITVTAEINWGENLGNGNWNIGRYTNIAPNNTMITGAQFDVVNGAVQFADTEFMGFWAD
ncbi:MAG: hypothetical protein JRH04_04870, partial [Deltaproteobacteria bacterium]|nr:hypothetical protein [Deltaproteobacteria bacterium]